MNSRPEDFLETADEIGAKLCRNAIWAGKRCNWVGPSMEFIEGDWRPVYRACGPTIYNGTSGVALFLQHLADLTGFGEYRRCAAGAYEQALSKAHEIPVNCRSGFYTGVTGIAYAGLQMGRLETSFALLKGMIDDEIEGQDLDLVSGSAGAIAVLLALHARYGEDFLLDLATRHGDYLVRSARRNGDGWSWNTLRLAFGHDLTGLSHGTSGIAWAMLELFARTAEPVYRDAALQALQYERRWFSPVHGNWPDFRTQNERNPPGSGDPSYSLAWCHGAPGIGLARVRAYEILGEPWCREEAETALRTTSWSLSETALRNQNFSLCHGAGGNAELPLASGIVFQDETAARLAHDVARFGIETFRKKRMPWSCGVAHASETPSLMLGLAGIGYLYLRLYDPAGVPSVLLLEQPRGTQSAQEA